MRLHPVVGLALAAGATALCALLAQSFGHDGNVATAPRPVSPVVRVATAVRASSASPAASAAAGDPTAFEQWILTRSSLRGTDRDGAWDVDLQGRPHPTIALRRRFDHLLTLLGETSIEDIQAYIEQDVRELAGPDAAAQMLDLWQRYLMLQRYAFRVQLDLRDRNTWGAALEERQQVRRLILGRDVALAFYGDEEEHFSAMLQSGETSARAPVVTGIDRTRLGADALALLAGEDAAWADWERRLAMTQREIDTLKAAPEMSAALRQDAIDQVLLLRFDTREVVRVRALLQLPPASPGH